MIVGYIKNGEYHKEDFDPRSLRTETASTHKAADHDNQRRDHRRDLIQPYKNGKPNPDFLTYFPEESKTYGFRKEPS